MRSAAANLIASPPISKQVRKELVRQVKCFVCNVTGSLTSDDPVPPRRTPVCPVL